MSNWKKRFEESQQREKAERFSKATSADNLLTLSGSLYDAKNSNTFGYTSLSKRWENIYKRALDYYNNEAHKDFLDTYNGTRNTEGYVSDTARWYRDLESQRDAANEGVDELLAELDQYSKYYNEDAVSYVRDLITKRQSSYDDVLKDAGSFRDHWSQWATEDDYNTSVWENDFYTKVKDGKYDEAEKALLAEQENLTASAPSMDMKSQIERLQKISEYGGYLEQERLYSTYNPETYNANVQRINELKKELGNIGFFENLGEETVKKISELSGGAAGWTRKEVLEKELERLEAENSRYLRFADPEEYQRLEDIENAPWWDRTLNTVGDLANDVLYGASKGVENTVEFLPRVGLGLADMIAGEAPTAFKSWVDDSVEDLNYDWAGNTHNIYDDTAARKSLIRDIPGGEQVQKTLKDVAQGVGNLIPAAAATAATGNPLVGEMIFFANSAGGATEEASLAGVRPAMAMQYGAAIGGLETATEKLGGSVFGEASDLTDTALGRWMIKSGADKYVGKGLGKAAYTFASEGVEESIMDIITPFAQSAFDVGDARETYFGENWKEGWSEVISGIPKTFVVGGTVGSVIEGFHSGVSAIANKDKGGFRYNKIADEMTIIENALKAQEAVKQSKKANPKTTDAFSAKTNEKISASIQSISKTMQKLTPAQRAEVFADAPMLQMFLNEDGSVSEGFKYFSAKGNTEIISLIDKITKGEFKDNDKVYLNNVSDDIAERIQELTGVDVRGFKVAIEARQLEHIIKDHGENGKADQSMKNSEDVAKIEYVLDNPDAITKSGKTQAYSYMKNGYNRTADTVIYEKNIGEQSYYAVQAIPDTKAKTLYIVTAFIGQSGYQKGASQLINANSPNATSEIGSAITPTDSISQGGDFVNGNFSTKKGQHISQKSDVQAPNQTSNNELSMNAVNNSISQTGTNVNSENLATPVGQAKNYARILGMGENGTRGLVAVSESLQSGADLGNAAQAFNAIYNQGKQGKAFAAVKFGETLTAEQRQLAYQYGIMDRALEGASAKNSQTGLSNDTNSGTINTYGKEAQNEQGIHLRDGGEWNDGTNTSGQVSAVEGRAREAEEQGSGSAQEARTARIGAYVQVEGLEKVSTRSIGVSSGTDKASVVVIPESEYDDGMRQIIKDQAEQGRNVVFVSGSLEIIENGEAVEARGLISEDGKTMWIQADSDVSAEQISLHEEYHAKAKSDPSLLNRMKKKIKKKYKGKLGVLTKMYAALYFTDESGKVTVSSDYIFEEICADAYAGIDVLESFDAAEIRATDFQETIREGAKGIESTRAPPSSSEVKASRATQDIYTATSDFARDVIKEDRSAFTSHLLSQTRGMKPSDVKGIQIFGAKRIYFFLATEEMTGKVYKSVSNKRLNLYKKICEEFFNGIEQSGEGPALWAEFDSLKEGGDISDTSLSGYGRTTDGNDTISEKSSQSNSARSDERSGGYTYSAREIDAILKPLKEMYGVDDSGIKASRTSKSAEEIAKAYLDAVPKRMILANALESVVSSEEDKKKLRLYKYKIKELDAMETELSEVNANIRELSFATGPRDKVTLAELKKRKTELESRISRYDSSLIRLEASEPIQKVLRLTKKQAVAKVKAEAKVKLDAQRERAQEALDKQAKRYQESRKKSAEGRHKTEMRHKIQRVVAELDKLLRHGNKKSNVKIGLQDAVAAALEAFDINAEKVERYNKDMARLDAKIATATDSLEIEALTALREKKQRNSERLADKLQAMKKAYEDIHNGRDGENYPGYYKAEAEVIENRIAEVIEKVGNTPIGEMSLDQLDAVYDMYRMVLTTVQNANKVFRDGKLADLTSDATDMTSELQKIKKLPEERLKAGENVRGFVWNELTPYYAFKRVGSGTLMSYYDELVRGQDVYARDVDEAKQFALDTRKKHGYGKWKLDEVHSFRDKDGRKFDLTLKHMMSIYAYSKREQALDHMEKGGFFFNNKETFRKKAGVLEFIASNESGYKVDASVFAKIKGSLTAEQIAYVDEMQSYLTKMGEKGNEVTRVMWGIDIFKEKVYFPLKSKEDFIYQANTPAETSSLKNDGMTKETKPHASNPIVLEAFDEVWANHVEKMSKYHGFVIPIDNLNKLINYGTWMEGNAQASNGIGIDMSESERYEIVKGKSIRPQKIEVNPNFNIDFEYLEKNIKSEIEKPLIKKLRELGYLKRYKTDAIEVDFEFTGGGLRKSLNSQATAYGGSFADLAKVVLNLQKLLDNSVLIEIHSDKGAGTDLENKQLVQTFVMMSAFAEGNSIVPVQFEVKQFVDNANRLYLAVALTKIETGVVGNTTLDKNQASTYLLPVSSISISDLFAKINIKDENFFKYIPDGFLSADQIDAKNRALAKDEAKYGKKTRVSSLLATHGLQLPARLSISNSTISIAQGKENVNSKFSTNAEMGSHSISTMLEARFGSGANDYLTTFIKDLNGAKAQSGGFIGGISNLFTKFKKTAVGASLSVVVQQPTAIIRATSEIDAKYFAHLPKVESLNKKWEQIPKYAPIAIIKDIGGFDAGSGRSIAEWINADTRRGVKRALNKIDDVTMYGAALGDRVGWGSIWTAVIREVQAKQGLKYGTEEFWQACGKRFTEVIVKTQVYDSTLSRSGFMRGKDSVMKMATSFMGEPTLSVNMIADSILQAKRGKIKKRQVIRTVAAVYTATVAASIIKSFIYALRDDDEDESFAEKYMQALGGTILNDINPLSMLPVTRDVISILEGWDVGRSDMEIVQDLYNAITALDSEEKTTWRKIEDLAGAMGALAGIPAKNFLRTAREVYNLVNDMFDGIEGGDLGGAFLEGLSGSFPFNFFDTGWEKTKSETLYEALIGEDPERIAVLRKGYDNDKEYFEAARKALREFDPRIREAAKAYLEGNIERRDEILDEIVDEGNFDKETVGRAIEAETDNLKPKEDGGGDKEWSRYYPSDIGDAFNYCSDELALAIIAELTELKIAEKLDEKRKEAEDKGEEFDEDEARAEAEKSVRSALRKAMTEYWKEKYWDAYEIWDDDEMARIKGFLEVSGLYVYEKENRDVDTVLSEWIAEYKKENGLE